MRSAMEAPPRRRAKDDAALGTFWRGVCHSDVMWRLRSSASEGRSWPTPSAAHSRRRWLHAGIVACGVLCVGCAAGGSAERQLGPPSAQNDVAEDGENLSERATSRGGDTLAQVWMRADAAREAGDHGAALTAYLGALQRVREGSERLRALRGVAAAHESLGDFASAGRAWRSVAQVLSARTAAVEADDGSAPARALLRAGACDAEAGAWEASAEALALAAPLAGGALALRIEVGARHAFALFQLDRLDEVDAVLDDLAPSLMEVEEGARLSDYYFVGMARFYRAAASHRRFRAAPIRLPEARMADDFAAKLALLETTQDAYREVIRARHVFWVSAAGYQLGVMFEEFYDALMYAPIPRWLNETQRRAYYEELKLQLRPVVNKAIWVLETNLETAARLGYDNMFIEETERTLARLQGVLLEGDQRIGQPTPRLQAEDGDRAADPPVNDALGDPDAMAAMLSGSGEGGRDTVLFIPTPSPL